MLGFLEYNINMPFHITCCLTRYNQSSLEGKMNEPIFYIKVPAVTEKAKKGEKKGKKKTHQEIREKQEFL